MRMFEAMKWQRMYEEERVKTLGQEHVIKKLKTASKSSKSTSNSSSSTNHTTHNDATAALLMLSSNAVGTTGTGTTIRERSEPHDN